jgi:hypothetical protein
MEGPVISLNVKATIEIPTAPNALRRADGIMMKVCDFPDDSLKQIGAEWTKALIANAERQRAQPDSKGSPCG